MTESNINNEGLGRFLTAQDGKRGDYTLYELALKEIKEGKLGFECWIRYVYPQPKRKGTSQLTDFYGLDGREEAKAYFEHPILRERLIKAAQVLLVIDKPIFEIFSNLGVMEEFQTFLFLDKSRTNTGGNDLLLVTFLHNLVL